MVRGEQRAPENATHPKTQVIDRFRVCCVFGCSLFPSKRAPKHTRKRNEHPKTRVIWERSITCVFGCSFALLPKGGAKTHPKTQRAPENAGNLGTVDCSLRFRVLFAFLGALCVFGLPKFRKIRAPIKIKSALPPPPKPKIPPPLKRGIFVDMVFPAERTHFSRRP